MSLSVIWSCYNSHHILTGSPDLRVSHCMFCLRNISVINNAPVWSLSIRDILLGNSSSFGISLCHSGFVGNFTHCFVTKARIDSSEVKLSLQIMLKPSGRDIQHSTMCYEKVTEWFMTLVVEDMCIYLESRAVWISIFLIVCWGCRLKYCLIMIDCISAYLRNLNSNHLDLRYWSV